MNPALFLSEADRYLAAGDTDRAAALYARAHELLGPRTPIAAIGLARIALLLDRAADAASILDAVVQRAPRNALALTLRGVCEDARSRFDAALTWYARALAADPTFTLAHVNQGRAWAQLERWDLAAASYTVATKHGADEPEVHVQLAITLYRAGRPGEALKALATTVQRFPRHLDATLTLADLLVEAGQLALADALLAEATARFPAAGGVASKRAAIALRQKDVELARAEAWRHTELSPDDEEAWLFAAVLDTMQLRFDTAEQALCRVLALNPGQWRAHYHLGGLYDALKDRRRAAAAYRRAIECNEHAWEPLNNLGLLRLEEGSPDALAEARSLLERAARLDRGGDPAPVRYNLALACLRLGDEVGARRAARELLQRAPPEHPLAREASRLLRAA